MIKGKIISGQFGRILARQKSGESLEIGELLIAEPALGISSNTLGSNISGADSKILLQVCDLMYGSQISLQNLELVAGMGLEDNSSTEFMDAELRNYNLAILKSLMEIKDGNAVLCKGLPGFFSQLRTPAASDFDFLSKPNNPLLFGKLRSGTNILDFDVFLDAESVLTHHVLISATTGRGKSNLCSVLLWNICDTDCAGVLVLDPHDEYFGRNKIGLKDHPKNGAGSGSASGDRSGDKKVVYYTSSDVPSGQRTLKINLAVLRPGHFSGVSDWSDAQYDVINSYHKAYDFNWIEAIVFDKPLPQEIRLNDASKAVVRRRLLNLLDLKVVEGRLLCNGVFDISSGKSTIPDITRDLESGKLVIIDTSQFAGDVELLMGTVIASEIFYKYKRYKSSGELKDKPVISIILEEAPRVLGKDVLERGQNIFSTLAREGRKFKVGLVAITQLPSLIPRQILANINTKIIMGTEMKPERQALIESAAQDLSDDDRNIASLDKGEAIITSNFARFALPIRIPFFDDFAKEKIKSSSVRDSPRIRKSFQGIDLE